MTAQNQTPGELPSQAPFLLEPIYVYIGQKKMTPDTISHIWFMAHMELAKDTYNSMGILFADQLK